MNMFKRPRKKLQLLDANLDKPPISWDKCIICQNVNNHTLIGPTESGYRTLSENLIKYAAYESLPSHLQLDNLYQNLIDNNAKYHKNCTTKYNAQKIERLMKKPRLNDNSSEEQPSQTTHTGDVCEASTTRLFTRSVNSAVDIKSTCIFCDQGECTGKLVSASTLGIGPNILAHAQALDDQKLLTKLYSTDLVALEAKYHKLCYVSFLNKVRSMKRSQSDVGNPSKTAYGSVLSELVTYMQNMYEYSPTVPVFRLAKVVQLVEERLHNWGFHDFVVNRTRLKDQLIAFVPGLREDKISREVILTFEGDVHNAIIDACNNNFVSDGMCLSRAASILREDMFNEYPKFEGSFKDSFTGVTSVSKKSVMFFRMLLEGASTGNPITSEEATFDEKDKIPIAALTIAQLVRFNSIKRKRQPTVKFTRHNVDQETPLPLYVGLMLHNVIGGEKIIEKMYHLGISVSYKRVQQVETNVASAVCEYYKQQGDTVCPPNVLRSVFTCAAIDNIDHDTSSNTSVDSFHGTSISLIQHSQYNDCNNVVETLNLAEINPAISLPDWYVTPAPISKRNCDYLLSLVNDTVGNVNFDVCGETKEWLQQIEHNVDGDILPWAAFHSRKEENEEVKAKCTSVLLPLLKEDINSPAMVCHTMKIVARLINNINPEQSPVVTADQPVYAIAKQLQWRYPALYGEDKMFVMLGGLHIEMAVISMIGTWLQDCGWTENLIEAGVTTSGRAESFLRSSHVKRSRYAHEVSYVALKILQQQAYNNSEDAPTQCFIDWCNMMQQKSPQFKYWTTTIELEGLLLVYVRSIRQANFLDFISSLERICPWMFALDHVNYARWLTIFVQSLWKLPKLHPKVYKEFLEGHFVGNKSQRKFSCIAHDQIHEQNNKLAKLDSSKLSLLSNKDTLLKWMTAGPEIARMNNEFEETNTLNRKTSSKDKHHEDSASYAVRFRRNVMALVEVFKEHGNPFEDTDLTNVGSSRVIMSESATKSVYEAQTKGEIQYSTYINERLVLGKTSIHDVIKRNNLQLFNNKKITRIKSRDKQNLSDVRKDSNLFCRLYVSSQVRDGDVEDFFSHENSTYPPSISEFGKLRLPSNKADIVSCIQKTCSFSSEYSSMPMASALIIDGAALVHMLTPGAATTFQQYCDNVVKLYIKKTLETVSRVDIVFDQYLSESLKSQTRQSRGCGERIAVQPGVKIPQNFKKFLTQDKNKEELFNMLAINLVAIASPGKEIFCTTKDVVLSSAGDQKIASISPSSHEEADARLLLHASDAVRNGHRSVIIKTVDSDVVAIALCAFPDIAEVEQLWIEFGTGKNLQFIPIHELHAKLPTGVPLLIPFFHAFTGCDTVSSFSGIGKKSAWKTWLSFREVDSAFHEYSHISISTTVEHGSAAFKVLERFVVLMYHATSAIENVNQARRVLFTKMNRNIEHVPPTADALMQHLKRAIFQCNIWRNCLSKNPPVLQPCQWGWETIDNIVYKPLWTTIPDVSKHCQELVSCKCKERCTQCRCVKNGLRCTLLCACEGHCSRIDD